MAATAAEAALREVEADAFSKACEAAATASSRASRVACEETARLAAIRRLDHTAGTLAELRTQAEVGRVTQSVACLVGILPLGYFVDIVHIIRRPNHIGLGGIWKRAGVGARAEESTGGGGGGRGMLRCEA